MNDRYARWVDEYGPQLLKWAWSKTGSQQQAEDLAQDVWVQFFTALHREENRGRPVDQPEHLLWKIARYVWCSHARRLTRHRTLPLEDNCPDEHDFAADLAQQQEHARMTRWLRQQVMRLNRVQREALILFYIEQRPQREIAQRLGLSESTLRWHLFATRQRLRQSGAPIQEGASDMTTDFVYRPRKLHMGINGQAVPELATQRICKNLLMQNICCACYHQGRTAQELAEMLGVARPYIEHDLHWLVENEFLTLEKERYFTAFMIQDNAQEAAVFRVFEAHKETLCDAITGHLLQHEALIRDIGFIGSDRPMNKLLWLLIYRFCCHLPCPAETPEPPVRPDSGKYWPLGFDRTDPVPDNPRADWAYNGSMYNDGFCWFGLHDFGQSEIEDMMDAWTPEYLQLRTLLEKLMHAGFDPACVTAEEQYTLAQLAEKGFVTVEEGRITPNYVILTKAQYDRLYAEVFRPLAQALQPEMERLAQDLHTLSLSMLPPHLKHLAPLAEAMAQHDVAFTTELLAFLDGTLHHPESKREGEFLTMAYIFR